MPQLFPLLIRDLSLQLRRQRGKSLVLVIGPSSRFPPHMPPFTRQTFDDYKEHLDALALMTYDYSSPASPGPIAPVRWMEDEVKRLCPDASDVCAALLFSCVRASALY